MTDKQPTDTNWLKGIAIAVAIITGVYFSGAWLVQSDWLFNTIEEKIEETASQILDAEVQIEEVTGEIFSQLSIQGLSWKKLRTM